MEENQRRKAFYEQLGLPAPAIEQLERVKKTFDTKQMQKSIERLTAASTAREAYLQLRENCKRTRTAGRCCCVSWKRRNFAGKTINGKKSEKKFLWTPCAAFPDSFGNVTR